MPISPVIVCGLGRVGRYVLEYLRAANVPVVLVDTDWPEHESVPDGARLVRGDCRRREVLEEAGVQSARGVMILTNDDLVNVSAAMMVRSLHSDVRIVLRMFNQNLLTRLGQAVRNVVALSTSALTAPLLATIATSGEALGTFDVPGGQRQVTEVLIRPNSTWLGKTVSELVQQTLTIAVAHVSADGKERLLNDVDDKAVLQERDKLVLCGEPQAFTHLLTEEDTQPVLAWAGRLRRLSRILWGSATRMDLAVQVVLLIFLATVLTSTLIYRYSVGKSWGDGLYRTISVMTTATDMHEEELRAEWHKFFVSFLRIIGTALTAAFTAIIVNFLLRIRLEGALEAGRIPERGHVVVCGLSNVGYRIVEALRARKFQVVVIESSRDNRFLTTARRQKVPVLIGDATVPQTLKLARSATARAVVAATEEELANLEIALLAREASPKQRVVVLLNEPRLAKALREASNIRYALSIASLAAPAFVAVLYSDSFQSLFLIGGKPLVVVELSVQEDERQLNGQTIRALMVDYGLLPVGLAKGDKPVSRDLPTQRLAPGDRLTAIFALSDLERLLRRQSPPTSHGVEIIAFPLPARPWVLQLLRMRRGLGVEEAEAVLNQLPALVAEQLTRGQAEDLLALMQREKVAGRVVNRESEG